jgi:glutathione S-transferase
MKLIGMLDSPYVRRVAISLQLLGLRFEHDPVSVFRTFAQFREINPVVKAPTLICDDGEILMDSSLILIYAESLAKPLTLIPQGRELQRALRIIGFGLAACEKAVQIVYEHRVRPPEKLHEPWVARVSGQLQAAFDALEAEIAKRPLATASADLDQAGITTAVAWYFTRQMLPEQVPLERYPRLAAFSAEMESLPEFMAAPHGDGTYRAR